VNRVKVELINDGRSPIVEPGVDELIAAAVREGRLVATVEASRAIQQTDLSIVCVGTPGQSNGSLDLTFVKRACRQIGEELAAKPGYHVVALRSSMLPGTMETTVAPALEVFSGKRAGRDFGMAIIPEFLREGSSIADFDDPPFTLIGASDSDAAAIVGRLFSHLKAPLVNLGIREAEMVKYACNCFHAAKVTFANEIGSICKALSVDSHAVMEAFCLDTKLNLSATYLKPGFAFGGSCLPKDLRAIAYRARQLDVEAPMLESILASNRRQVERAAEMVLGTGCKQVGILGLSFKPGTDDLRESPMVTLVETLIGKGLRLSIHDRDVELARLFGANKEYIEREIPHISSLLNGSPEQVIDDSQVVVIGKNDREYQRLKPKLNNGRIVIDLVRLFDAESQENSNYRGICW
jgi:GDP-mannose 6-dehydrogenase